LPDHAVKLLHEKRAQIKNKLLSVRTPALFRQNFGQGSQKSAVAMSRFVREAKQQATSFLGRWIAKCVISIMVTDKTSVLSVLVELSQSPNAPHLEWVAMFIIVIKLSIQPWTRLTEQNVSRRESTIFCPHHICSHILFDSACFASS